MTAFLVDTDPGIDDALALVWACGVPGVALEAVTTVAGNVPVDQATTNVFRLLALCRPAAAPVVAVGAAQPLVRTLKTAVRYHGADGLGDLHDWPAVTSRPVSQDAPGVIAAAARRLGPQLTVVALGPLTNVALALEIDADALRRVGRLVVMGGAVDVPGNVTPMAEFNVHVDPDAAARVFAAGLSPDLVPLDATRQATLARRELETTLQGRADAVASRVLAFTRRAFRLDADVMHLHDPLAMAVAVDPTLVEWEPARLEIDADGATRRGAGPPNCRIARRVDRERFIAAFLDGLCRASS